MRLRKPRATKPAGRVPGTRARGPVPEPGRTGAALGAVAGVLALLGAVAAAPHAWDLAREASRREPFLLETVTLRGLDRLSPDELVRVLGLVRGVPLVEVEVAAAVDRLRAHPWIADASAVRVPPDALAVSVRERVPLAVVDAGQPPRAYAVDETGTAFAPAGEDEVRRLVAVVLPSPPAVGEPDPRLGEALELAAALRARGLEVPRRLVLGLPGRDESAEIRLRGFAPAVWIERPQAARHLDRLGLLLAAHVEATQRAAVIDLRFEDRAVLRGMP